jgi:hypothetical protein
MVGKMEEFSKLRKEISQKDKELEKIIINQTDGRLKHLKNQLTEIPDHRIQKQRKQQ